MSMLDQLLDAIGAAPALPGARCRFRHELFDPGPHGESPTVREARQAQALQLCASCPSRSRCEQWFDSLPKSQRPRGVVAGRVHSSKAPGRPKASTA